MSAEMAPIQLRAISLLSLNIWNVNEPFEPRMSELVRFLRYTTPDIVALQEVSPAHGGRPQSQMIATEAGYRYAHYVKSDDWQGRREEGLAILTRMPSSQSRHITLPLTSNDMQRIAQVVRADLGSATESIYVVNTHFAFHPTDTAGRLAQTEALIEDIGSKYQHGWPIILCGDLNDDPESESVRRLFKDPQLRLRDAWSEVNPADPGWTFVSSNPWAKAELWPDRRIDYIAVSETLAVQRCSLALTGEDGWGPVSDHYGILAQISPKLCCTDRLTNRCAAAGAARCGGHSRGDDLALAVDRSRHRARAAGWQTGPRLTTWRSPTPRRTLPGRTAQFTALRYFTLDGTDRASHKEQARMIRGSIIWRNRHADDQRLREVIERPDAA